jgi:hypothetical protein
MWLFSPSQNIIEKKFFYIRAKFFLKMFILIVLILSFFTYKIQAKNTNNSVDCLQSWTRIWKSIKNNDNRSLIEFKNNIYPAGISPPLENFTNDSKNFFSLSASVYFYANLSKYVGGERVLLTKAKHGAMFQFLGNVRSEEYESLRCDKTLFRSPKCNDGEYWGVVSLSRWDNIFKKNIKNGILPTCRGFK